MERKYPIGGKQSPKLSKYFVKDIFYQFWFRFIFANLSLLEFRPAEVQRMVEEQLSQFQGRIFENVCKEFLLNKFKFDFLDNWWGYDINRKEVEIDLLGKKGSEYFFVECKWKDKVDAGKLYTKLVEKSRVLDKKQKRFVLIARSFKESSVSEDVLLYDLKNLENFFLR